MSNQTLYDVPSRMFPRGKAGVLRYHTVTYSRLLVLEYTGVDFSQFSQGQGGSQFVLRV